jgi:hypothetical protein
MYLKLCEIIRYRCWNLSSAISSATRNLLPWHQSATNPIYAIYYLASTSSHHARVPALIRLAPPRACRSFPTDPCSLSVWRDPGIRMRTSTSCPQDPGVPRAPSSGPWLYTPLPPVPGPCPMTLWTYLWNTKHLQHEILECNISLEQMKHLDDTLATWVWNIYNIQIKQL